MRGACRLYSWCYRSRSRRGLSLWSTSETMLSHRGHLETPFFTFWRSSLGRIKSDLHKQRQNSKTPIHDVHREQTRVAAPLRFLRRYVCAFGRLTGDLTGDATVEVVGRVVEGIVKNVAPHGRDDSGPGRPPAACSLALPF